MKHLIAIAAVSLSLAATARPADAQQSYTAFIIGLRAVCARQPARDCTGRVAAFLDGDGDRRVTLEEFEAVRRQAMTAVTDTNSGLSKIERNLTAVALLALQQAKPAAVFANFDGDGDGALSEGELFADFRLGRRPLGDIIADPDGVDWAALAERFGKVGFLLRDLLPPSHRQ